MFLVLLLFDVFAKVSLKFFAQDFRETEFPMLLFMLKVEKSCFFNTDFFCSKENLIDLIKSNKKI